jgi:NADPH-dependent ferric siderophore reductase
VASVSAGWAAGGIATPGVGSFGDADPPRHHIFRMRRERRRRLVTVAAIERITPNTRRIRFVSPDPHDFESLAPDDHIRLFLPNNVDAGGGGDCYMHDYMPRAFDAVPGTRTIDFALHASGPATTSAKVSRRMQFVDTTLIPCQ